MTAVRIAAVTALAVVAAASSARAAVVISCVGAVGVPGGTATVHIALAHNDQEPVAGTQNDLTFDPTIFNVQTSDCAINPDIGPGTDPDKQLNTSIIDSTLRAIVVSLNNVNVIPSGDLYTCAFHIAASAAVGEYQIANSNLIAGASDGSRLPVTGTDCSIAVGPTPTPTPHCRNNEDCPSGEVCVDGNCVTPTPTATPIGFCDTNQDCPPGEVCVDHHCVTPTPTATPIGFCDTDHDCPLGQVCVDHHCVTPTPTRTPIGFCDTNEDCPPGNVCVDHHCVTPTPTPTKKKSSGGGGCNCEIDPGAPATRTSDVLAVLLPAVVLLLRWRARRRID